MLTKIFFILILLILILILISWWLKPVGVNLLPNFYIIIILISWWLEPVWPPNFPYDIKVGVNLLPKFCIIINPSTLLLNKALYVILEYLTKSNI